MPNIANHQTQHDPKRVASAALQAFFNVSAHWKLSVAEERTLLGSLPESTFYK